MLKATKTGAIFPNALIELGSFDQLPNAREQIKAEREEYSRDLNMITAPGTKTSMKFNTMELSLAELELVLGFFTTAEDDNLKRTISLEYWNDESLAYKTGIFYRPNITYTKKSISSNDIIYKPISIELIEC